MKSLHQMVTRRINARTRVYGRLRQGRFKSKIVEDQRYLEQLLIYIHLNPVQAGLVDDLAGYRWSGHGDLLGLSKDPIVDVDAVLRVFGKTRRSARAAYVRRLKGNADEAWIGEEPGRLPWWRLGRPPKREDEDPETAIMERRSRNELGPEWRPRMRASDFVAQAAEILGLAVDDLRSRRRSDDHVRARELLMLVGVERYRLKVSHLAKELRKSPDGMSQALARAVRRRADESSFLKRADRLDRELAALRGLGPSTIP